jgi:hypothetical protein
VFERFTDRARRVVVLAQEEARLLNHNYIGTEHILLGLIHDQEGVAAKALDALKISHEAVRRQVIDIVGQGEGAPSGHIPFTPRAKKVLELSLREAIGLGHNYIGTEHILLGLVREGEGVAATIVVALGGNLDRVRAQVIETLADYQPGSGDVPSSEPEALRLARGIAVPPGMSFGANPTSHCSFCGRDLWEVDRYIASPGASICPDCVTTSHDALSAARASDQSGWGPLQLPPRVFGPAPREPSALPAIEHAFRTVFADATTDEEKAEALEDGSELLTALVEARQRVPALGPVRVHVQRVRFLDEGRARVGFAILLGRGNGPSFEGTAVETNGVWRVSRETFCHVVAMAGVRCPPTSDPAK